MSNVNLFIVGSLVTLLVIASMSFLIWGAILDGRNQSERTKLSEALPRPIDTLQLVDPMQVSDAA